MWVNVLLPPQPAILDSLLPYQQTANLERIERTLIKVRSQKTPASFVVWDKGTGYPAQTMPRGLQNNLPVQTECEELLDVEIPIIGESLAVFPRRQPDHYTYLNTAWWHWGTGVVAQDLSGTLVAFYNIIPTNLPGVFWHEGGDLHHWGWLNQFVIITVGINYSENWLTRKRKALRTKWLRNILKTKSN